jgi:hypothetical protein
VARKTERAIGRAAVILKADKVPIDLVPISHDPTEAGLIGAAYLAPHRIFEATDRGLGKVGRFSQVKHDHTGTDIGAADGARAQSRS